MTLRMRSSLIHAHITRLHHVKVLALDGVELICRRTAGTYTSFDVVAGHSQVVFIEARFKQPQ